ncbi:hypothetical protein [Marinicauda sp. Alg238-R41]|uniref:hypothetical protein n=1 Tax=Marinicauda sp. Alg238-R41 TaxID=2993447 RepID=UPI0022E928C7|nr:hypothetical protein [Marinicauda sp. Alg238-R41]
MTLEDQILAISERVSALELKGMPKVDFLRCLLPIEKKRWQQRIEAAYAADPANPEEAAYEAALWNAAQHFNAVPAIEMDHAETQAAVYIMYIEGAFGPYFDGEGEPTSDQIAAIARADRVAAGLLPQ